MQSLGVATMLVEAGGWPETDPEPMTRLHFHGMLATLDAIATDRYRQADAQIYEDLPESNSLRLSDCLISKANAVDARSATPYVVDLVVDQPHSERLAPATGRDGRISDIGDLAAVPARLTIHAADALVVPGQFTLVGDWQPGATLEERRVAELLAQGTTTAVGVANLAERDALEALAAPQNLPFHWTFVGRASDLGRLRGSELVERIAIAAANGLAAVITNGADETLWRHVSQFGLPLIKLSQLAERSARSYHDAAKRSWNAASALKQQTQRGRVNRGYLADLLFFDGVPASDAMQPVDWQKLTRVMVAGETVWENGKRGDASPGVFLQRS
jgi:hypothetical protein